MRIRTVLILIGLVGNLLLASVLYGLFSWRESTQREYSSESLVTTYEAAWFQTLETSFENGVFKPVNKKTNKFIYPGIDINSIDALITNFHLPKSSLFILICALMGTNKMIKAYEHAIKNNYRFYSYGDACLLEK